ncbi:rhodanese-like domain-containing protein 4, chloroplastic [Hibiscus syriacus]|uniref:rhodanese-like domain-containing protein 4, chloroplastic n=1 Tax=Hibiscus syriacus TaxID=106335 RepID=UPI0019235B80|nr:rhodanese-like domain-containing protein 4, chloroplastic [Hibiscus syriacus]
MRTLIGAAPSSTSLSILSDRRTETRQPLLPSIALPFKPTFIKIQPPRSLHGGLLLLSSVLPTGFVEALSYEEALQQTTGSPSSLEVDPSWILDSVLDFATENPTVVAGGAIVLAVPLILSQLLKNPKPWGIEPAKNVAHATTAHATTTFSAHPRDFPRLDPHAELPHATVVAPQAAALSQLVNAAGAVSVSQQS